MRTSGGIAIALGLVLVLPALAGTSAATHEETDCEPTSSSTIVRFGGFALVPVPVTVTVGGKEVQVLGGTGLYWDTNVLPGIQRADSFVQDETCGHNPDVDFATTGCQGSVSLGFGGGHSDLSCAN